VTQMQTVKTSRCTVFMLMDYVSAIAICNIITINKYLHSFIHTHGGGVVEQVSIVIRTQNEALSKKLTLNEKLNNCLLNLSNISRVEVSMQYPCRIIHSLKNTNGYPCVHAICPCTMKIHSSIFK